MFNGRLLFSKMQRLEKFTEIFYNNCFQIDFLLLLAKEPAQSPLVPKYCSDLTILTINSMLETRLLNGMKLYKNIQAVNKIFCLVEKIFII